MDKAESIGAEFKLEKCMFAGAKVELWGFELSSEGRKPSAGKVQQFRDWPEYEELADIRSHVHFCEYLKEFIPDLPDRIYPLRPY